MAFIRNCFVIAVLALGVRCAKAQTVYYPARSSQLLKATAVDMAMLLQSAIPGSAFNILEYTQVPATGIILVYDSIVTGNGSCKVESNGTNHITFRSAQDNGLNYGVYQYLEQRGFHFYLPGAIWEIIPTLVSPYKLTDTTFTVHFKYQGWFISGGQNRWVMDNNANYNWDTYYGENGHNWALYQRRNGMTGGYRFTGHRGDIMTGAYLDMLKNNPCYIACNDGLRVADNHAVPDINNQAAMQLWSGTIEKQYTQFRNTIHGNVGLYADYYRNFNYYYGNIGIEVPDGAAWGNSKDNTGCSNMDYPAESDQHIMLANFTAQSLKTLYPEKQFQLYAYSSHANTPTATISIDNNIDVQVISTAFQNESSAKGLLNRWYNKTASVSEYHYLNIPQWGGETPMFYLDDLKSTLQRVKEKNSQGIVWEASPAKFASLPFLLAANTDLKNNTPVDSTLQHFCNALFAGAANSIFKLLQLWSDDRTISTGEFIQDNKYKLPVYLQLVNEAGLQTKNASPVVKERIRELKAYMHYMLLYYDWLFDQRSHAAKTDKAAALCLYLAGINKLQLVNSYFLIADITSRYSKTDPFYVNYNVINGGAYQNGNLPLVTPAEMDADFQQDLGSLQPLQSFITETAAFTREQFANGNILPVKEISVKLTYTNGSDYPNRSEFYIDAPAAGNFSIQYTPHFNMPDKGHINFTLEAVNKALMVIRDFTIDQNAGPGSLTIPLPASGTYKLSVVSKYKSAVDLIISTNGNSFYKKGAFLGNKTENYRSDLHSFPGYFYVPGGAGKIYFSINNSNPGGSSYASPADISKAFVIKDNNGNTQLPRLVTPNDSAFFYIEVPPGTADAFWQVSKMEQYNLCFTNISNLLWYAERQPCVNNGITVSAVNKKGTCITRLTAASYGTNNKWTVNDMGKLYTFIDQPAVELPDMLSSNAVITLTGGGYCTVIKRIGDDMNYIKTKEACVSGSPLPVVFLKPVLYPNPSNGIYNCLQNGEALTADEISITTAQGVRVAGFKNARQFNISQLAAGVYWYRLVSKGEIYSGKLVKF